MTSTCKNRRIFAIFGPRDNYFRIISILREVCKIYSEFLTLRPDASSYKQSHFGDLLLEIQLQLPDEPENCHPHISNIYQAKYLFSTKPGNGVKELKKNTR